MGHTNTMKFLAQMLCSVALIQCLAHGASAARVQCPRTGDAKNGLCVFGQKWGSLQHTDLSPAQRAEIMQEIADAGLTCNECNGAGYVNRRSSRPSSGDWQCDYCAARNPRQNVTCGTCFNDRN